MEVSVLLLFLTVPWVGLHYVIVFFLEHNHLLVVTSVLTNCFALRYFKYILVMYICSRSGHHVSESLF